MAQIQFDTLKKIDDFTSSEYTMFQYVCRKLLKMTFIVREKNDEHRKDFIFIKNNLPALNEYFRIMGYGVKCDIDIGVAQLVNLASSNEDGSVQSNRRQFRLVESIVLSALWLMYEEAMVNGGLTRAIIINKIDLEYQLEKIGLKSKIKKEAMKDIMNTFEKFNLVEVIGEIGEPDCKIRLFTSMQFCLSETKFHEVAQTTAQRMQEKSREAEKEGYALGEDGGEDD